MLRIVYVRRGMAFIVISGRWPFFTKGEHGADRFAPIGRRPKLYSSRIKLDGSMESARRAGIADAAKPSKAIVKTAPPRTAGSPGFA